LLAQLARTERHSSFWGLFVCPGIPAHPILVRPYPAVLALLRAISEPRWSRRELKWNSELSATTHGFKTRRALVSGSVGGKPKVCPKCSLWFGQQPRERICQGCRPRYAQTLLATRRQAVNAANVQVAGTGNRPLGTVSQLLGVVFKPGVSLTRVLALEAAAVADGKVRR
jgi:hypothetical protein